MGKIIFSSSLFILFCICQVSTAQVTIGSGFIPQHGSILDLKENDNVGANSKKGMLLPRVPLEDIVKMDPCVPSNLIQPTDKQTHIGLTVYNTTDAVEKGLCPGIYVWIGDQWKRIPQPCESAIDPQLVYAPNCYIVSPGQPSEEIPIAKAYLVSESRSDITGLNRSDKVSLNVLWQDTKDLIDKVELVDGDKGIYSKFKVTAKGTTKGNASVALHIGPNGNDTDPIAWSWHIWVTDYNPNPNGGGTTHAFNNTERDYVFMDRNIGAISTTPSDRQSLGMMYQWGRKDPFTAAEEFTTDPPQSEKHSANFSHVFRPLYSHPDNTILNETNEDEGNGGTPSSSGTGIKHAIPPSGSSNLERSIQNPVTFYYGSYIKNDNDYLFDWYSGDATGTVNDDELWGTTTQKSPFDPCPAGWRVPAYSSDTKSPWGAYIGNEWSGGEGVNLVGGRGFNFVGAAGRAPLGYYPSCFPRAPKAFFTGGFVGVNANYSDNAGGSFFLMAYEVGMGVELIQSNYWTSTVASATEKVKARLMFVAPDPMMGISPPQERLSSKATGAFVRCVEE